MKRSLWWPVVIILTASAMALAIWLDIDTPWRVAVTFVFVLISPGMAFVRLFEIKEWLIELTLAVAVSIGLSTLVSEVMVLTTAWSPRWGGMVLIALSLIGVALQLIRNVYPPRSNEPHTKDAQPLMSQPVRQ
jgi:hypothetical protein